MEYPILEINKTDKDYPKCLLKLGDIAPDCILAKGNIYLLSEPIAAIISTTEQTEENAIKVGRMFQEVPSSKYHYLYDIESSVGKTVLDYTYNDTSKPIVVMPDLNDNHPEFLTDTNIHQLEDILEDGGLLISFHYDNPLKWKNTESQLFMMAMIADVIAVPLCSKTDVDVRKMMGKSKELGKKVVINKEEYIKLFK